MREMGIQAIYPRQNTGIPEPSHKIYPYLLKGLKFAHPDHVWSIGVTYIPVKTDLLYLAAIIDRSFRFVLHWEMDDSMEIDFVLETCRKALGIAVPEVMNCDQGSHFTSPQYTTQFLDSIRNQHGSPRPCLRQYLCRAPLEDHQIRGCLSEEL